MKTKKTKPEPKNEKPIIFFDLETTGVDINRDRIVQIAGVKYLNNEIIDQIDFLINPAMPIPAGATEVHGITNEDVKDAPTFQECVLNLSVFFAGADLAGFNQDNYDIPLLAEEFARAGYDFPEPDTRSIDVKKIFHLKEPRTLSAGVKFYLNKEHDGAHRAIDDVLATSAIFDKMKKLYKDMPEDRKELELFCNNGKERIDLAGKFTRNDAGEIVWSFGRHVGTKVTEQVEYARWIYKAEFPRNTKTILAKIMKGEIK